MTVEKGLCLLRISNIENILTWPFPTIMTFEDVLVQLRKKKIDNQQNLKR